MSTTRPSSVLFSDDFNTENNGSGRPNFSNLTNWNITDGSVDLLGKGYVNFFPQNGVYLDLDGTTGNAARLESKQIFNLQQGDEVTLTFSLAGSQRGDQNQVNVSLGGLFNETFSLSSSDPFKPITRSFTVTSATSGKLVFDHAGGDNVGLLLDDVELKVSSGSTPLNENLIINPGGELSPGASDFSSVVAPDGWETTSNFSVLRYDITGSPDSLHVDDSASINGGRNYFAGGPGSSEHKSTATQTIDLSDLATQIDSQSLQADLGGFLGGYAEQQDNMTVDAKFYNRDHNELDSMSLGPVSAEDRDFGSKLLYREVKDFIIPIGARSVDIVLIAQTSAGGYTDGYADNLDFRITSRSQQIIGTNRDDVLVGSSGDDTITGLRGNDTLSGNDGNDILIGGRDNDILNGGSGSDSFEFDSGRRFLSGHIGIDTIEDFEASDKIILDKTTFTALGNGALSFSTTTSSRRAERSRALIVYDRSSGALYYNENGRETGFGSGGQFAVLTNKFQLTDSNFEIRA